MKIVFTAGGGGHFAPLLATLSQLKEHDSYHIIGRKYAFEGDTTLSLEYRLARERNLPFTAITTGRLQRSFTRHTLPSLAKIPVGLYQAIKLLQSMRPDVVVSFGGYVSVPVVIAAKLLQIPIIVHEQTPRAGLANKIASRFATRICVSWESSRKYFPKEKTILIGNPMQDIAVKEDMPQRFHINGSLPLLVIVGGSLGSHALNSIVSKTLFALVHKYRIIHQTGNAEQYHDYEALNISKDNLPMPVKNHYLPVKFLDPLEFPIILSHADLVITRVGINTALSLLKLEKPALLIPLPYGQKNEQLENARLLEKYGIAEILEEHTMTEDTFVSTIERMISTIDRYRIKDGSAKKVVSGDAAAKLYEVIQEGKTT